MLTNLIVNVVNNYKGCVKKVKDFSSFTQIMYSFGNLDFSKLLNNISKSEYVVMLNIKEYTQENNVNYINVTKLAELVNVSVPAISRVLKSLECKKYIIRDIDLLCRRNTMVKLTLNGSNVLKNSNDILNDVFQEYINELTKEEQEVFVELVEKIYKVFCKKIQQVEGE